MDYKGEPIIRPYYGYPNNRNGNRPLTKQDYVNYSTQPPMYYNYLPYSDNLDDEMMERDSMYMKSLYPEGAKRILEVVEDECDKLEYDGSVMFDEYPDRLMVGKICSDIYGRVKDELGDWLKKNGIDFAESKTDMKKEKSNREAYLEKNGRWHTWPEERKEDYKSSQDSLRAMDYYPNKRPCCGNNWINDMIQILLFQEMYRRRCRRNHCRRRWYW